MWNVYTDQKARGQSEHGKTEWEASWQSSDSVNCPFILFAYWENLAWKISMVLDWRKKVSNLRYADNTESWKYNDLQGLVMKIKKHNEDNGLIGK